MKFSYKDYKEGGRKKEMTLTGVEFIRRFLLHVLPEGFCKIRHFRLLSNRQKQLGLKQAKKVLKVKVRERVKLQAIVLIKERTGKDISICPSCKKGKMEQIEVIEPRRLSPYTRRQAVA